MSLKTFPIFRYGLKIDRNNRYFQLVEDGAEVTIAMPLGNYYTKNLLDKLQELLNSNISLNGNYQVEYDHFTRKLKIVSSVSFQILLSSGTLADKGIYELLGFRTCVEYGDDLIYGDGTTYGLSDTPLWSVQESNKGIGYEFKPTMIPFDYIPCDHYRELIDAKVNESPLEQELISFGEKSFFQMSFKYINNGKRNCSENIRSNENAVSEVINFLNSCKNHELIEFYPDESNLNQFYVMRAESLSGSNNATGFKLQEMNLGICEWYETGIMKFRKITKEGF